MNYYLYIADDGTRWSIRARPNVAAFMSMFPSLSPLPRWENTSRKIRLTEVVTGKELLIADPDPLWTLTLGDLELFDGDLYLVTALIPEFGRKVAP